MRQLVCHVILSTVLTGTLAVGAGAQLPDSTARDTPHAAKPAANVSDSGGTKRNVLPVLETVGFLTMLSLYDRVAYANVTQDGKKVYSSTFGTTWDHIRQQTWVYDQDPFSVNQFQHPYQGATMYGLARSSGHNFWASLIHANVGSFIWKMAGETDPPSLNDMITTGQAGSLLGEALYRIADLVLKNGPDRPHRWQEYSAYAISPPTGLNRRIFGERFKARLPDTPPATVWQLRFGATLDILGDQPATTANFLRSDVTTEFSMSYGLPGQPGYEYTRPLDYFDFQFSILANASNPIESMMIRGLLLGSKAGESENAHGIWGLYGSYDYIAPTLFRISSTALSLGTTRQYEFTPGLTLQGSMLGGVGYGAAGSTAGILSSATSESIRDYHFGLTPQALLALRVIASDRVSLDLAAREYYVSGVGSDDTRGSETIFRGNVGLTIRLFGGHSIGAKIVRSTRDAQYGTLPNRKFSEQTLSIAYSILGGHGFGPAVEVAAPAPPAPPKD